MTEKRPILAFAPNDWDGPRWNRQHLLSRLARRGWRIAYSTGAPHFWSRRSAEWRQLPAFGRLEEREGVLVDRPSRLLMRREASPAWDRQVIRAHLSRLRTGLRATRASVICYVFHPSFWPYVEVLKPARLVYHVYDAFHLTEDWSCSLEKAQARLVERADLLVATSRPMAASFPNSASQRVEEIPNGVDYELFAPSQDPPCPADLSPIPKPRIVLAGSFNEKIDLGLVHTLARTRPEWHWVLLGRLGKSTAGDGELGREWRSCLALPNVHYLGAKPHEALPGYLHHADVNVMCYRMSGEGWWHLGYPLRLHELLAVGRPIVASRLATLLPLSSVLALPSSVEEWCTALESAISSGGTGNVSERRSVARQNTWMERVTELERCLLALG